MSRYVCIHGHFYQPPRENPWLEAIELQYTAYPYHDWNERITAECYEPNAASRILDAENRILQIVDNYSKISFNFGPTLLAWMEHSAPAVYQAVLDADKKSQETFSGHGSALAQVYNHVIMPLANRRDKYTQILWGIRDFENRFERQPEGMWLPETAVDYETLDIMAELGLRFTILAPHQAGRVRGIGETTWHEVNQGTIDPSTAYELHLPSGRKMALFFYHESIARAVAFEGLLTSGENFGRRLAEAFSDDAERPQLVHIATDGETFGHHHRHGDMALAYALYYIETNNLAQLTNYGEYLEKHPPTHQVEIIENTSWSCVHGIERWRSHCGCATGGHPGWNQAWREPLRDALDWLRDTLAPVYEEKGSQLLKEPWAARDDYIEVVLNRSTESVEGFLHRHARHQLTPADTILALKLLELQRHAMLMFTSCGWFFDELSRIETVQVLQYAGRAIQLAQEVLGDHIEPHFLEILEKAKSNLRQHGDGRRLYESCVRPAMVDLTKVAAHYVISSLFEEYGEAPSIFCFRVDVDDYQLSEAGRARLAVGRAKFTSEISGESQDLCFGVLHFGDHNLNAGVAPYTDKSTYETAAEDMTTAFNTADFPDVIRVMDHHFGSSAYSARSLFRDEQRKVLDHILQSTLLDVEAAYRNVYEQHYPLMRFLAELGNPLPMAFRAAAEFILDVDLCRAFGEEVPDVDRIQTLLDAVETWQVELDTPGLSHALEDTLQRLAELFQADPEDMQTLQSFEGVADIAASLPFEVDYRKAQNVYYDVLQTAYPELRDKAERGSRNVREWLHHFRALGEKLSVQVD